MSVKRFLRKLFPQQRPRTEVSRKILIVDDDEGLRDSLKDILESEGYETVGASTMAAGARIARDVKPTLALVDLKLPDGTGAALLSDLKNDNPDVVCILMTAYADVDSAILAIEKGAFYYLRKPVKPDDLVELVDLAFETIRLKEEKTKAEHALKERNVELEEIISRLKKLID